MLTTPQGDHVRNPDRMYGFLSGSRGVYSDVCLQSLSPLLGSLKDLRGETWCRDRSEASQNLPEGNDKFHVLYDGTEIIGSEEAIKQEMVETWGRIRGPEGGKTREIMKEIRVTLEKSWREGKSREAMEGIAQYFISQSEKLRLSLSMQAITASLRTIWSLSTPPQVLRDKG